MAHIEMTQKEFEESIDVVIKRSTRHPDRMNKALDLRCLECSVENMGSAVYGYTLKTGHLNPYGGMHGGVVAALLDTAMGITVAARTNHFVITTDLSVSYLRALSDSHYRVHIEVTHLGRRMASLIGKVFNADNDELCATGMGTFMLLDTGGDPGVQV